MDYFECCICCERFEDPRVLPCGHTACYACLKKLKPQALNCPLCRNPFNSVDSLPKNIVILQWMASLNQTEPKSQVLCDNCEVHNVKVAEFWCKACGVNYCPTCDGIVHARALQRHERVLMKDKETKIESCLSHSEEKKVYCTTCKMLVCGVCVVDHHKNHDTVSVFKYSEGLKDNLKGMVQALFNNKDLVVKIERYLDDERKEKIIQIERLREQIKCYELELRGIEEENESWIEVNQKYKSTHLFLLKLIEGLSIGEVTNQLTIDLIRQRIQEAFKQVHPEQFIHKLQQQISQKKERLEKERLEREEKERLEKEKIETLQKVTLDWWDRSGNLGGMRQSTHNPNVYYLVSKSNMYDPKQVFQPPPGFKWISTQEASCIFTSKANTSGNFVYYNQGGWEGTTWRGVMRYQFVFSDSATTDAYKHAGNCDEYKLNYGISEYGLAGIVCWKINHQ